MSLCLALYVGLGSPTRVLKLSVQAPYLLSQLCSLQIGFLNANDELEIGSNLTGLSMGCLDPVDN